MPNRMIRALFEKQLSHYSGYQVKGHAYQNSYGKDIICSAVSVLVLFVANHLEEDLHVPLHGKVDAGFFECRIESPSLESDRVVGRLEETLRTIAKQHPKNLKVEVKVWHSK